MTASPPPAAQKLFAYLDALALPHTTHWHEATFTVDQGRDLKATLPGAHSKNLFMTDKDGVIVLISAHADNQLRLNQLHKHIATRRLSFASPELMQDVLGVAPGSVTAFALMNDTAHRVRFIADAALMAHDILNFHPLINTGTTAIAREDFKTFVQTTGHQLDVFDFSTL